MALADRILVMRNGVVQQVGSPIDIYEAPVNRFVFEFIGLSSFLEVGLDRDRHAHRRRALRAAGERGAAGPNSSRPGQACLATRPGDLVFVQDGGLPGRVVRKAFLGEVVDYRVAVGGTENPGADLAAGMPLQRSGRRAGCGIVRPRWYPYAGPAAATA